MDIKSFRVENSELTLVIGVADQRAALNLLQTLLYSQVESLTPSGRVLPEVVRAKPAPVAAAQAVEAAQPAAPAPVAAPAPAPVAAPAPAPVAVAAAKPALVTTAAAPSADGVVVKRGPGRPRKIRPEDAAPAPAQVSVAVVVEADEDDLPPELVEAVAAAAAEEEEEEEEEEIEAVPEPEDEVEDEEAEAPAPEPAPAPQARVQLHSVPKPVAAETSPTNAVLIAKLVDSTKACSAPRRCKART